MKLAILETPSLPQQIAIAAIQQMLAGAFFSICPILDAAKVLKKEITPETKVLLKALHCVYFNGMTSDVKGFILDFCNELVAN